MQAVIQRVRKASVSVAGTEVAAIGPGLLVLVGFAAGERPGPQLARMADRLLRLRIFEDEEGRMNRSLTDIQGDLLLVPEVTLTASLEKGTRPSFHTAAPPAEAKRLFEAMVQAMKSVYPKVATGVFQAYMLVSLDNDGPVTFVLAE